MEEMKKSTVVKSDENLSIIERIVQKTGNPKIAAVLALDLFLVGVDTVNINLLIYSIDTSVEFFFPIYRRQLPLHLPFINLVKIQINKKCYMKNLNE